MFVFIKENILICTKKSCNKDCNKIFIIFKYTNIIKLLFLFKYTFYILRII